MKNDNYFEDDAPHNQVGDDAGMSEGSEPRGEEKDGEGETALINSDICPDMKPGDVMELRIVAVHEGEYQVQYMPKEEDEEHGEGEEAMAGAGAPPDSMMD